MRVSNHPANDPKDPITETQLGRCLVEGDPVMISRARRMRRQAFGMSLTIELTLLAVLVVGALFSGVARLPLQNLLPPGIVFVGSWHTPNPVQHVETGNSNPGPLIRDVFFDGTRPAAPAGRQTVGGSAEAPDLSLAGAQVLGGIPLGVLGPTPRVEPPHPEKAEGSKQPEKRPLKISEGVLEAQLTTRVEPRYPPLAVLARKEGTVVLHAIISREGRITSLEVVSGSPLLIQAALDAVRQWRYRPTMLNGEPVEVETTITVVFQLRS